MTDLKPKFYTKSVIIAFSILLSTFFGALLFSYNLIEAGKKKGILNVILFTVLWNFVLGKMLGNIIHNTLIVFGITNLAGGIILAFLFWKIYLKEKVDFDRKKVWGPLILLIVIYGAFISFLLLNQHGL
jgi:hypothetical protein